MKDSLTDRLPKFSDPDRTAKGDARAKVALSNPKTLWFNTGTLCNIACASCYIESSPSNDRLVFITSDEVEIYLDQINDRGWPVSEIAFTGGEPFMNPQIIDMLRVSLARGYEVLVLTNAMRPMMRKKMRAGLAELNALYPNKMTIRVSVDHFDSALHDGERGAGAFDKTLQGMSWLRDNQIPMAVAGRAIMGTSEAEMRAGFARLFEEYNFDIDAQDTGKTVLFPEMDDSVDVPEITTDCWGILNISPASVMCATSRMVVKRKGADSPTVLACTLLPYDSRFDLGKTLADAEQGVSLNHPHCAKFCVLGGASCSA